MHAEGLQTRAELASAYQQQLQALGYEIRVAMQAIANNSLSTLEESVAKQQVITAVLTKLAAGLSEELRTAEQPSQPFPGSPVEDKVRATSRSIYDLNAQYASLLKHSGRTIHLLSNLCRSHTGQFPEVRRTGVKRHTWSCEM